MFVADLEFLEFLIDEGPKKNYATANFSTYYIYYNRKYVLNPETLSYRYIVFFMSGIFYKFQTYIKLYCLNLQTIYIQCK